MQIRVKYDLTLFPLEVAQENWVFLGVYCFLGGLMCPPWAQVVNTGPLATVEMGSDEKIILLGIFIKKIT